MKKVEVKHEKSKGCFKYIFYAIVAYVVFSFFPLILHYGMKGIIYFVFYSIPVVAVFFIINIILKKKYNYDLVPIVKNSLTKNSRKNIFDGTNNLQFSINGRTTIENPFAGIFISGGAGSGKSKSLIEPLIKEAGKKGYTGVIYDFKFSELAEYAETAYKNTDVTPYYFNFADLTRSHRINPIAPELMRNESFAREFAFSILANLNPSMISKPDFWSDNSTSLLSAVFWYLREKHPIYCTLPHAISMILQPNTTALLMELSSVPKCADTHIKNFVKFLLNKTREAS